ncbi:tetratricopeptide repeat protein [Psychroserpens algicola]|uniref:tetratricopeptide repeat protein n=1 Tax=Psychroserpens algicola TaxID=1719034 RepID=UPI001953722D|nr:hypothetical protein [Psychroserpens algicola]
MKVLFKILLLLHINFIIGQSVLGEKVYLKGHVYLINSGSSVIEGITVNSSDTNADITDGLGEFILEFNKLNPGDTTSVFIGDSIKTNVALDKYNDEYELVNPNTYKIVVLSKSTIEVPLKLTVARKGYIEREAQKVYLTLKKHVDKKLEIEQQKILKLEAENIVSQDSILKLNHQLQNFKTINDSIALHNTSLKIASFNRDGAEESVKKALTQLRANRDIEAALKELNPHLSNSQIKQNLKSNEQAFEALELRSRLLLSDLKVNQAIDQYKLMIETLSADESAYTYKLIDYISMLGILLNRNLKHAEAEEYLKYGLSLFDKHNLSKTQESRLSILLDLGKSLCEQSKKQETIKTYNEGIRTIQSKSKPDEFDDFNMVRFEIGLAEVSLNQDATSVKMMKKIRKTISSYDDELNDMFGEDIHKITNKMLLAMQLAVKDNRKKAESLLLEILYDLKIIIELEKKNPTKYNPLGVSLEPLASSILVSLARLKIEEKKTFEAIDLYEESIPYFQTQINKANRPKDYMDLSEVYGQLAYINYSLLERNLALEFLTKAESYAFKCSEILNYLKSEQINVGYRSVRLNIIDKNISDFKTNNTDLIESLNQLEQLETSINSSDDLVFKLNAQQNKVQIRITLDENYKTERFKNLLASEYGGLSWHALEAKEFELAETSAKKGLAINSTEQWIYTNLALAYLFQGKIKDAKQIYKSLKNEIYDGETTYKDIFLQDLEDLKHLGIKKKHLSEVYKILSN